MAVLRGALLDLLATDDEERLTAALAVQLGLLRDSDGEGDAGGVARDGDDRSPRPAWRWLM
ncbi:hypothetical protein [Streptomyces violaceorubidus]|uniref:Uncharacterized protein n=1 Tax=Streptomyces violaceorubidus TaxID=284042 RepID=A0ABV1SRS7_9ACTN